METYSFDRIIKVENTAEEQDVKPTIKQEIKEEVIAGDDDWRNLTTEYDNLKEEQDQLLHDNKSVIVKLVKSEEPCMFETKPTIKEEPQDYDPPSSFNYNESNDIKPYSLASEEKSTINTKSECPDSIHVQEPQDYDPPSSFNYNESNDIKPYALASEEKSTINTKSECSNSINFKGSQMFCKQEESTSGYGDHTDIRSYSMDCKENKPFTTPTEFPNIKESEVKNEYPVKREAQNVNVENMFDFKTDPEELKPYELVRSIDVKPNITRLEVLKSENTPGDSFVQEANHNSSNENTPPNPRKTCSKKNKKLIKTKTSRALQSNEVCERNQSTVTPPEARSSLEENTEPSSTRVQTKRTRSETEQTTPKRQEIPSQAEEPNKVAKTSQAESQVAETDCTTSDDEVGWSGEDYSSSEEEELPKKKKRKKNDAKKIDCKQCDASFAYPSQLRLHEQKVHDASKPFPCHKCYKAFHTKKELKMHTDTDCYRLRPFKCEVCNRRFNFKHDLKAHNISKCGNLELSPFQCDTCGKKFRANSYLRFHVKTKCDTLKLYKCKVCNREFKFRNQLTAHEDDKCGAVKRFKCDKCGKEFKIKPSLVIHVASNCVIYGLKK